MIPRDIYEFFRRAREALDLPVPCRTTAKANWIHAKKMMHDMVRNAPDDEKPALQSVVDYVEEETKALSLDDDIDWCASFWEGYMDGCEGNTLRIGHTRAYEEGYFASQTSA